MTVQDLLRNYRYNGYSDPLNMVDYEKGVYVGVVPIKINGEYFYCNVIGDSCNLNYESIPSEVMEKTVDNFSIQSNYALSIWTKRQ